ncbi:MAG: hypothetical protein QOH62_3699, partial [Solirubrobacteraceae bacterium]|nr:hypothetical protein [Solirubrobacteraceae bacterium]
SIAFAPGTIFVGTSPDVWPGPALAALSTETGAAAAGFAGDTVDYAAYVAYAGQTLYVGGSSSGDARRFWILRTRPPHATTAPALAGEPLVGATLTCSDGVWSAEPASLSRRWLRDGSPIDGATGSKYVATGADADRAVACEVTAANERGSDAATTPAVTVKGVTPPVTGPGDEGGKPIVTAPATAPKVKKASCRVRKGAVRCTLTFDGAPRKVSARLLSGKKVVAKAGGSKTLTFKARKRLKPGRYTLAITGGANLRVTVKK